MSKKVSKKDNDLRKKHKIKVQPKPELNTFPSAHDLIVEEISKYGETIRLAKSGYQSSVYRQVMLAINLISELVGVDPKDEIRKRKEFGLEKYGTILQPFNGRNNLEDALDELIDAAVYLRAQQYEERVSKA